MKLLKIKILEKILSTKIKPLTGNNRSFSNRATRRTYKGNVQKFKIEGRCYRIPVKSYNKYLAIIKRSL